MKIWSDSLAIDDNEKYNMCWHEADRQLLDYVIRIVNASELNVWAPATRKNWIREAEVPRRRLIVTGWL
jgi:hypothetical protein